MSDGAKAHAAVSKIVAIADQKFSSMVDDNVLTIFHHLTIQERKDLLVMCVRVWSDRVQKTECSKETCGCVDSCEMPGMCASAQEVAKVVTPPTANIVETEEKKLTLSMVIGAALIIIGTLGFALHLFLSQPPQKVLQQTDQAKEIADELLP